VLVHPGDIVVADEEGVEVVPHDRRTAVLDAARAKLAAEAEETLDEWEAAHHARIDAILRESGFVES
jgi:regulator of RNase E activity RraA